MVGLRREKRFENVFDLKTKQNLENILNNLFKQFHSYENSF